MPSRETALATAAAWLDSLAVLADVALPAPAALFEREQPTARGSRILATSDGWWCLTLSRESDLALVPALISAETQAPWDDVTAWSSTVTSAEALERAILLGLPASVLPDDSPTPLPTPPGPAPRRTWPPRVIDLSSLWAGPLAASLLQQCGASVVKVASTERPDGLESGDPAHYDRLNANKRHLSLPLITSEGRSALLDLVADADIVIESSRPRALAQLGIDATALVRAIPGLTWVSITAYGRTDAPDRVGFGDDIAFGAGLVSTTPDGVPTLIGDALADPLTGIYAAYAALGAHQSGSAGLLDISMHRVARAAA